jgi:hypothetical protein
MWWQYALWGLAGASINRALIYLEASQRVKGWPWRYPHGPGGGAYFLSVVLHCGIGGSVTAAAAQSGVISNALLALGMGASAPAVVKKLSQYTLAILPQSVDDEKRGGDNAD